MARFDGLRFEGRAAVITGAARGQGRSHAVRLAREGADVIALDICHDIDSVAYDLGTSADLEETARLVAEQGRRAVTAEVDVRDADAVARTVADAAGELGGIDIVLANAGIGIMKPDGDPRRAFRDQIDVNLVGVWNTVQAAAPLMIEQRRGGAVVITSSVFGLIGRGVHVPDPRVREDDVDAAEPPRAVGDRPGDGLPVPDVDLGGDDLPALLGDQPRRLLQVSRCGQVVGDGVDVVADVEGDHVRTLRREPHGVTTALPARGAGDDCRPALESGPIEPGHGVLSSSAGVVRERTIDVPERRTRVPERRTRWGLAEG